MDLTLDQWIMIYGCQTVYVNLWRIVESKSKDLILTVQSFHLLSSIGGYTCFNNSSMHYKVEWNRNRVSESWVSVVILHTWTYINYQGLEDWKATIGWAAFGHFTCFLMKLATFIFWVLRCTLKWSEIGSRSMNLEFWLSKCRLESTYPSADWKLKSEDWMSRARSFHLLPCKYG